MAFRPDPLRSTLACTASALLLAGCGGGSSSSGGSDATPVTPVMTTTNVTTSVIDGALRNALVCVDKNVNGRCDTDEVQGRTDAAGSVTLAVPNADVGKYPIVAAVGTDAVDADHGAVPTAYTMSTPADQTAVVSPLTTLVQRTVADVGATTAQAAKSVQDATGLSVSLFQDYTKAAAPTDGSVSAAAFARLLVVTTQQQTAALASAVGATAIDGTKITQTDIDKAVQQKVLELLPAVVTALGAPAVLAATTPADKEAALAAAATSLVGSAGLTPTAAATAVAVNNQVGATVAPATPGATIQLFTLSFASASNYSVRLLTGSVAQNTPDSTNHVRYVDRRARSVAGRVATWGSGSDPWRQADLNWNGTAWVGCPLNFENSSSVRDAQGNSSYGFCDGRETGTSNRAVFDIGGKTLAEVYAQIVGAGYTNLSVANPAALGSATFPTGASVFYQTNTALTAAISYYAAGTNSPAGTSNLVSQYSSAVAAGGVASTQAAGVACNSTESSGNGTSSTTFESLIPSKGGTPCTYAQGTLTSNGVTYTSDAVNDWWGNSTLSLGTVGAAALSPATGYYTGNTLLRVAFTGSGANATTYYACKQRSLNGSPRGCVAIGSGTYAISTLGDARVMTFSNLPAQTASLTYTRVLVERGGAIYLGYQSKPSVTRSARLNTVAARAFLAQLGVTAEDPSVPLALTATSYQGTWDFRQTGQAVGPTVGTTVFVNADGTSSCVDKATARSYACTLTVTDAGTGAFTLTDAVGSAAGTMNFAAGSASGTFNDPTATPSTGSFVGGRR